MPTVASVQDPYARLTVISEHAQGTASLMDGTIDVWLDRRLKQDDRKGLEHGVVQDNRPTQTRLRVVYEYAGSYVGYITASVGNVWELSLKYWIIFFALKATLAFELNHYITLANALRVSTSTICRLYELVNNNKLKMNEDFRSTKVQRFWKVLQ